MIRLRLTGYKDKHDHPLWECSQHGIAHWSNNDPLPFDNALAFLWQRLNAFNFEGPSNWRLLLSDPYKVLWVYRQEEPLAVTKMPVEPQPTTIVTVVEHLIPRDLYDQIQIYMHLMENRE